MTLAAYRTIVDSFFGASPYAGLALDAGGSVSPHGWGQDSPVFERLIADIKPALVIEVGTWLGASAIRMADLMRAHAVPGTIVCVDTWLGSPVHWQTEAYRRVLDPEHGYPRLYHAFLANVVAAGHRDTIIPLPQPAGNAARFLVSLDLRAELVYIDGDHDAESVYTHLTNYWPLVAEGGVMFGDDFLADWPGVVRAVELFADRQDVAVEVVGEKWILRKDRRP